jgi:pimeloyl-ACP methyl ester carboxylesterase
MDTETARDRMLAGLPVTGRMFDAAGVATQVWEIGAGPPMVLLHGGIECGGAMWAPVTRALAAHHRIIVPDLPGLGESAPVDRLVPATFAAWLFAVLERMQLRRPVLVAHSLAGSLAARFVGEHPDAIGRLVLYAAPGIGPYRMPVRLRYVAIRFMLRPTVANAERFDRFALHDLDATRRRDPGWFEAFDAYTRSRAAVPHVKRTMNRLVADQTRPIDDVDLAGITVPTTLLWGRHDRMVPLAMGQHAERRHGWPLHVIENAAHAPHVEQPEAFVEELERIVGALHQRS